MRKLLMTLMAVGFAISLPTIAEGAPGRRKCRTCGQNQARYYRPAFQRSNGPGIFSNLMEMERRKNQWLANTFFRR